MRPDPGQRLVERGPTGERVGQVHGAGIQAYRDDAREPADRTRQVRVARQFLLAAVAFQVNQYRAAGAPPVRPAMPVGDGQGQSGQQHVVDGRLEGGGHPAEQRGSPVGGQGEGQVARGGDHIPPRVERRGHGDRVALREDRGPQRELVLAGRVRGTLAQQLRPAAERPVSYTHL